ncbi:hypothetical protein [Hoylesella nanceiensis]|jgi:hypothetical protein|uniref:hypothetical protein n=1 Tax=Hoylesella nanceiensis TaxID=425941 RepID=UPI0028ED1A7E|nr:hypothetical protein [Hoylesella nanceiensis]
MLILILSLVVLGCFAALLGLISHKRTGKDDVILEGSGSCSTCNGDDEHCIHDCILEAAVKEVEYFDDENLDAFIGRESDSYTEKEIEQFREILYTMNQKEVADWNRSLTIRGINIPNDLKDEMIMMIENN